MRSRSKFLADDATIARLFRHAGIENAENISPLGAGEFNSVYSVDADGKAYAIKIAPKDVSCTLTYEHDMMRQEVYFYSLMKKAGINVPEIYYSDFSKEIIPVDYFIMERLACTQLDKANLTDSEKEEADRMTAEMIARMHSIRGEKFGYLQNGGYDDWYQAISAMIKNLLSDCKSRNRRSRRGEKLLRYVEKNRSVLEKVDCRLVNFDIWYANIFVERQEKGLKLYWIDPERCFFGDRIADFFCMEMMKLSLDKKVKSFESYNKTSDTPISVTDEERIRFAVMVGYLGVIQEVEKYARYTPFHFGWWRNVLGCLLWYNTAFKQLKSLTK